MAKPSLKRGISGAANALSQPFRLCGGSFNNPIYHQREMQMARTVGASDFRATATYANGVLGGILAKLARGQELSAFEERLIGRRQKAAAE